MTIERLVFVDFTKSGKGLAAHLVIWVCLNFEFESNSKIFVNFFKSDYFLRGWGLGFGVCKNK